MRRHRNSQLPECFDITEHRGSVARSVARRRSALGCVGGVVSFLSRIISPRFANRSLFHYRDRRLPNASLARLSQSQTVDVFSGLGQSTTMVIRGSRSAESWFGCSDWFAILRRATISAFAIIAMFDRALSRNICMLGPRRATSMTWPGAAEIIAKGTALMDDSKSHLRLVGPGDKPDQDAHEFVPLPFYSWAERPLSLPIDVEEAATAIHLDDGDVILAARRLKVSTGRLNRLIAHHPRLVRIRNEHLQVLVDKSTHEVASAFSSEDDRRREWATSKVLSSRLAQDHPLAPAPSSTTSVQTNIALGAGAAGKFVFRWMDDGDDPRPDGIPDRDHDSVSASPSLPASPQID